MEKIRVNQDACIGCGACQGIAPDIFEIDENGLATIVKNEKIETITEEMEDARDMCPTGAIIIEEK